MASQLSTLVGRQDELATLAGVLARADAGDGGVCLVTGEPGIGKTSLLERAAEQAAERGFTVTWGRAWEAGGAPAHWIWIEALRDLLAGAGDHGRRVESLVVSGAERAHDLFQLCDAVAGFVRARATDQPLLILFDDLHAADVASLQIALFVARQLAGVRAAIVGSYRDVEARMQPPVEDVLARLGRLGELVRVPRLDRASVAELVRDQVGGDDAEVAEMVMNATEGNPLFVRELLRLIAARAGAPGVPSGVRAVIRERLALLSPATVALLQAAAILGRDCAITLASEVAGVTAEAMADAAAEAATAALVEETTVDRLRFSHALVAETLAADSSAPVRARLHRKAAEILETQHRDGALAPVAEIAHHWLRAGPDAADRAVEAAARAARVAADRLAFSDAADLLDQATSALAAAAPADARRKVELMLARCEALARGGQRELAERLCHETTALARALDDDILFARVALALGAELIVGTSDPTMKRLLEEALERLPPGDSELRARVTARLAGARQPEPDPSQPIAQAAEAIAMARRLGDDDVLLYALHAGMAAYADYAPAAERLPLNRETAALAAARGHMTYELRARSRILFDCVELLDRAGFTSELRELDALVDRIGVPRYRWIPLMFRAMQADWEGRFDDGDSLYREARELAEPGEGPFRYTARALTRLFMLGREPNPAEERALIDSFAAMGGALAAAAYAILEARAGNHEAARTHAAGLMQDGALSPLVAGRSVHSAQLLAETAWRLGDPVLAALADEQLAVHGDRSIAMTGAGYILHSTVHHSRMRMAALCQRWDQMDRHAEAGLAQCERMGARAIAAQLLTDWAAGLATRPGAREDAVEIAKRARSMTEELGMTALTATCQQILNGAADQPVGDAPVTLNREGEYWTVRGCGEVCRMRDSRGMQMLAMLIDRTGEEIHVLDLSGARAADGGDAGAMLDDEARAAYETRLLALQSELDEAESYNDPGRAERARAELEALTAELSRAFGLGGRARRAGSAVERARSNVRRRIADALGKIADASPALGAYLTAAVRTGIYCAYEPR